MNVSGISFTTMYAGWVAGCIASTFESLVMAESDSASAILISTRFSSKVRFLCAISRVRILYHFVAFALSAYT